MGEGGFPLNAIVTNDFCPVAWDDRCFTLTARV